MSVCITIYIEVGGPERIVSMDWFKNSLRDVRSALGNLAMIASRAVFFVTVIRSWVLRYVRNALYSSSSVGLGLRLGAANALTEVAIENVDIGRASPRVGGNNPNPPGCDPEPVSIFMLDIIVARGSAGIIPYTLPVCWYPKGNSCGCINPPWSDPVTDPGPPPKGMKGNCGVVNWEIVRWRPSYMDPCRDPWLWWEAGPRTLLVELFMAFVFR